MSDHLNPERTVLLSVQVLPLANQPFPIIDRAIEKIAASGVIHKVEPMETVMEGTLDNLLDLAKEAHLACFEAGAEKVVTLIKIADRREGLKRNDVLAKYKGEAGTIG